MTTIQNAETVQDTQNEMRIKDMLQLCLAKWQWFVISLVICLSAAVVYLLRTPPVYSRMAAIIVKDEANGKTMSSDMESFANFGGFMTNSNINDEIGILTSPDLMRDVVSRLHLEMNYLVEGRFHWDTIYGDELPVTITLLDIPDEESATFKIHLEKDGQYTVSDITCGNESVDDIIQAKLGDTVKSPMGRMTIKQTNKYKRGESIDIEVHCCPV